MRTLAVLVGTSVFLAACTTPTIDPASYSVGGVGIANRSVDGVIYSANPMIIDLSNNEASQAGIAGAFIGGGANSGSDAGGVALAILVGAAAGAVIGSAREEALRSPGFAYIVEGMG